MTSEREPFYLAPERARLRLIPTPPPEPVVVRPDPIGRRSWVGAVWELARDAVVGVWGLVR